MIAACSTDCVPVTCYTHWEPVDSFPIVTCSDWYFRAPEKEPVAKIKGRWWRYLQMFLEQPSIPTPHIIRVAPRRIEVPRIHHERVYPRFISGRNNRNP